MAQFWALIQSIRWLQQTIDALVYSFLQFKRSQRAKKRSERKAKREEIIDRLKGDLTDEERAKAAADLAAIIHSHKL